MIFKTESLKVVRANDVGTYYMATNDILSLIRSKFDTGFPNKVKSLEVFEVNKLRI